METFVDRRWSGHFSIRAVTFLKGSVSDEVRSTVRSAVVTVSVPDTGDEVTVVPRGYVSQGNITTYLYSVLTLSPRTSGSRPTEGMTRRVVKELQLNTTYEFGVGSV